MLNDTLKTPASLPILVVAEDDTDSREAIIEMLNDAFTGRLTILGAKDGQDAYDLCLRHDVAALVTDQIMPRMTGLALHAALQTQERTRRIPTALLTGRHRDPQIEDAQRRHGFHVFLKVEGVFDLPTWVQDTLALS